jgi:MFS family permease
VLAGWPKAYQVLTQLDFADRPDGEFSGELKGIIAAAYSLGAMLSLPFIGIINDKLGRRWSIFGGSAIMVVGSIVQGFSVNGEPHASRRSGIHCTSTNAWQLAYTLPPESCLVSVFQPVLCLDLPSSGSLATPRSVHTSPAFSMSRFTLVKS